MAYSADSTVSIVGTSGSLFVSYSVMCVLYGALCIQAYLYYLSFPKDTIQTKCLVALLYVTVTLQLALKTRDIFLTYVIGFLDKQSLNKTLLTGLSVPVLDGLVGCAVQLFFTYRIWIVTKSKLFCLFLTALALLQCGAAIGTGQIILQATMYTEVHSSAGKTVAIWTSATAACDAIVASTLTYYYYRKKSGYKMKNAPLAFVVSMVIETGLLTALIAIVELILFFGSRNTSLYRAPAVDLAVLYANSCMAILNSRIQIVGGREEPVTADVPISSSAVARHAANGFVKRFVDVAPIAPPAPTVQIQQEIWSETYPMSNMKSSPMSLNGSEAGDEENILHQVK